MKIKYKFYEKFYYYYMQENRYLTFSNLYYLRSNKIKYKKDDLLLYIIRPILIKYLIQNDDFVGMSYIIKKNYNFAYKYANRFGNKTFVEYLITKGADDWDIGLKNACRCGDMELIKFNVEKGATNWYMAMCGSAKGGNLDILKYCLDKESKLVHHALYEAIKFNNKNIVDYLLNLDIEKDWLRCLKYAIEYDIKELVDYFFIIIQINKINSNIDLEIIIKNSIKNKYNEIVIYFDNIIGDNDNTLYWCKFYRNNYLIGYYEKLKKEKLKIDNNNE